MHLGGRYLDRTDLELTPEEMKILKRNLVCNEEIPFCQYLYDIKVYELVLGQNHDIISY
jgi:hypothetical protein